MAEDAGVWAATGRAPRATTRSRAASLFMGGLPGELGHGVVAQLQVMARGPLGGVPRRLQVLAQVQEAGHGLGPQARLREGARELVPAQPARGTPRPKVQAGGERAAQVVVEE